MAGLLGAPPRQIGLLAHPDPVMELWANLPDQGGGNAVNAPALTNPGVNVRAAEYVGNQPVRPGYRDDIAHMAGLASGFVGSSGIRLPMDPASRLLRAREMGFDPNARWYHATTADFPAFSLSARGSGANAGNRGERAIFLNSSPATVDAYHPGGYIAANAPDAVAHGAANMGDGTARYYSQGSRVIPALIRNIDDFQRWDMGGAGYDVDFMRRAIREARADKAPGVLLENFRDFSMFPYANPVGNPRSPATTAVVFRPSDIRSPFAAFDPAKARSSDILASWAAPLLFGSGAGVGLLGAPGAQQ